MEEKRRCFGGKLKDFKDKQERAVEKVHLAAYLKGQIWFYYKGKTYKVKQEWQ